MDGFTDIYVVRTPECPMCGKSSQLQVNRENYGKWKNGWLMQNAMPELTVDEREMLMTGTHPDCWDKLFEGSEG